MSPKLPTSSASINLLLSNFVRNSEVYGLVLLDRSGTFTFANRAALKILRCSEAQLLGKNFSEMFTPEDVVQNVHLSELKHALKMGSSEDERWHQRNGGERFWASGAVTVIRNDEDQVAGFCKAFRDNTLRKQTEEDLKTSNASLKRFSYVAAHDL